MPKSIFYFLIKTILFIVEVINTGTLTNRNTDLRNTCHPSPISKPRLNLTSLSDQKNSLSLSLPLSRNASLMAVYRSLKTLIRRTTPAYKFSYTSPSPFPSPPSSFLSPLSRSRSPLSRWITPFHGPLFLSSPPWKLSQSATPLYFQSDVVLVPSIPALDLLRRRKFPVNLEFDRIVRNEPSESEAGGLVESFVNLPNLISIGRLVSGPFLGW